MGGVFLALFVLVAVLRSRPEDEAPAASSGVDAETVRSFWELYNRAAEAQNCEPGDRPVFFFCIGRWSWIQGLTLLANG